MGKNDPRDETGKGRSAGKRVAAQTPLVRGGGPPAAELMGQVYDELRRLAAMYLDRERAGHTLQPTALVHEAYLKLAAQASADWRDANHFRAVAASAMRQILVDHAKGRARAKRGGGWLRVTLDEAVQPTPERDVDVLALDEAMTGLARVAPRKAQVVELRFFGGMTCEEAARALHIAPKTAEADWYLARAWLQRELSKAAG